jgi:DNA-directed RNA polymerase II subunit RPB1
MEIFRRVWYKRNIFLPQSIQTQIELEEIADVKRQIITPATSRTIIGIVQDGLLGAYNLTAPSMRIDWKSAMNIMSYTSIDDFKSFKKNKEYTGHELFSLIIPPKINVSRFDDAGKPTLTIKNGKLTEGYLTKDILGSGKKNNLTQLIWDAYSVEESKSFLDNTQRLINNFNLFNGFTVGIGDAGIPLDVEKQIYKMFETKEQKVNHMITEMENNPDMMDVDIFENRVFSELNVIRDDVSKLIMSNLKAENNFKIMISSGSKGGPTNMGQMGGCVGLQAFEGKLIPKKLNGRTLPYFFQNDDRAESRGLIKNSFLRGMTFPEFFYHNMTGREGLVDQCIKTAESGYIQRKLVKSLEDAMIKYDGTVRTASNLILQFIYGDSGADTTKQYEYAIKMIEMGDNEMANKHKFTKEELKAYKFTEKENDEYIKKLIEMRDTIRMSQIKTKMSYITMSNVFMLPINLTRIIDNTRGDTSLKSSEKLEPSHILKKLEEVLHNRNTQLFAMKESKRDDVNSVKYKDDQISKTSLKISINDALSPKRCLIEYGFSKAQFDNVIDEIITSFNSNIVEPGEMVGLIGAQSMGEPTTQMTLNAFHHSGIAAMSTTTQGVPRIKELISLTKNLKTPQMVTYLTKEHMANKDMAHKIASHIKYTTLGHLRKSLTVYYDPNPKRAGGFMEQDNVKNVYYSHNATRNSCQADINSLSWLMRIELDREKMLEKEVTLLDIKSKFCNMWEKRFLDMKSVRKEEKYVLEKVTQCAVLSNTDNDKQPVLHIRFDMTEFDFAIMNDFIDYIIERFKLKGIPSITNIGAIAEERALVMDGPNHDIEKKTQFVIYTVGVNLYDIRYINGIDIYKTVCNDIVAMYETFGVEAARATLCREISLAYERAGSAVNYNHLSLLVDLMTNNGFLTSIDRHGMNKSDVGPLSRASFEKTVDQLINAAVFGEVDHMKGISSRIMAGLVIKGGTGMCDVILDTDMLEKSEFTEDVGQKYLKTYNDINTDNVIKDIISKEEDNMFIPM